MATLHMRYRSLDESWTASAELDLVDERFSVVRTDNGESVFSALRGATVDELSVTPRGTVCCRIVTEQGRTILSAFDFEAIAQSEPSTGGCVAGTLISPNMRAALETRSRNDATGVRFS